MHTVETYDPTPHTYPGARTAPALAVVEDDDGFRWLLTADGTAPPLHLQRAVAAGAQAVLADARQAAPRATGWLAATISSYIAACQATVDPILAVGTLFDDIPALMDLRDTEQAASLVPAPAGSAFVNLHTHSEYSPLDGLSRIRRLAEAAARHGQASLAITDHGYCTGHPDLQAAAEATGIRPVFGLEAYLVDDVDDRTDQHAYWHLILLARDDAGLRKLWGLSTASWRDGFYGKPRVDWRMLKAHAGGLIATTACLGGPVSQALLADDRQTASARLARLQEVFGDSLYAEIQSYPTSDQIKVNLALVDLAADHGVPLVAAADSHYTEPVDHDRHQVWLACATAKGVGESGMFTDGRFHLHTEGEMRDALDYLPADAVEQAVANTSVIADSCEARIRTSKSVPLSGPKATYDSDAAALREQAVAGWAKLPPGEHGDQREYIARFEREMELLEAQHFCGYYMIVADYCLDPSTPVLTEDLRWVEVGKLEAGDRLAGFDENKVVKQQKGHRYWRSAEVVNTRRIVLPTYKIILEDGTETITSEDHQWLVASPGGTSVRWIRTRDLRGGQRPQRLVSQWSEPNTWEAGYIAGILDGEGSLSLSKIKNGGHSLSLGFAQKEGVVLETALRILDAWGFSYSLKDHGSERNGLRSVWLRGGRAEVMRLLGMARPQRLLAKLNMDLLGRVTSIDNPAIVSVEPLGPGEVVALETTTGTLVAQGFAHHNCRWAKDHDILVGPGRGSGGASLVAYLVGITEIDPVRWDLPFERFLTPGRVSMPDFDVDFPASKRTEIHAYLRSRWGEDHVVSIGNIQRMGNKATIRNLMRALRPGLPPTSFADADKISKIIDDAEAGTAGLGLSWEDLWAQHGERLQPYRDLYPQVFAEADVLNGTVITYGKHAAGVIISTGEPLTGLLPLRGGEDHTQMVTQFDDDGVEALGHVKFDILTLRTLDTVQKALDSIAARYGHRPDLYGFSKELDDPEVWEMISSGDVLGCFQIETTLGAQMCRAMRPATLNELADVITLVRPGPRNAGLTRAYLARRGGEQEVTVPDERLAQVLAPTWGVIIYQEQVLAVCRIIAGYSDAEADDIRKILGKKLVDKIDAAGRDFIGRAVQRGMSRDAATVLWEQMAEFSRYAFGKAHAYGYALLTWWTAFLKVHYPVEFIAAALSTVDKERIPEFVKEARRLGVDVLPPDINTSRTGFTVGESASVRYGLDSLKGIGGKAAAEIIANAPYTSVADLRARTGSSVNIGTVRLLARAGAFDSLPGEPHRAALVATLDAEASGAAKRCVDRLADEQVAEGELPCGYDWAAEPPILNERTGKKLAAKPPPKRCTAACRRYRPTGTAEVALVAPYTPQQIGQIELELLGLYLTWTPFHQVAQTARDRLRSEAEELASGFAQGTVVVLAVAEQLKPYIAKNGLEMGFVKLATEGPDLDTACMSTLWGKLDPERLTGALVLAEVRRTERGMTLVGIEPY